MSNITMEMYSAEWCAPCRVVKGILKKMYGDDYAAHENVTLIDIDKDTSAAQAENIRGIPTIIFKKDGEEIKRTVGMLTQAQLKLIMEITD